MHSGESSMGTKAYGWFLCTLCGTQNSSNVESFPARRRVIHFCNRADEKWTRVHLQRRQKAERYTWASAGLPTGL